MGKPSFLRIASLFLGTAAFLTPTPTNAQFVLFGPRSLGLGGGYGSYGGYPYGPGWPGFGGLGYGGPYYPGLYPDGYGGGVGYPGLYNYGGSWYPNMFQNVTTPGWPVGPTSADSYAGGPRMRSTTTPYPNTSVYPGGALVGTVATAQANEPAVVDVRVPTSSAEVWVQGVQTRQTGTERRYVSPPLVPGKDYVYTFRARWRDANGTTQLQQQNVLVQAGSEVRVAFPTGQ
jgi:uncharacterized protein (TIGR03000 family)